ncbi:MAG: methylated-DNA--[protein]-cysteine S-methyltransferase [Paludibacteraceae bacterium]|nr:methylated-DNA--[protein]-cysteine S-methyltransferase [Paludibacteraceae bacterium]
MEYGADMRNETVLSFKWGFLQVIDDGRAIVGLKFMADAVGSVTVSSLAENLKVQLSEYFLGRRKIFDIPLKYTGTDFQLAVWRHLHLIPYGETQTYKQVAEAIGCPKACRAVGAACHCNPIAIVIPCHRVVGKNESLIGYAGSIEVKQWLLNLEKQNK